MSNSLRITLEQWRALVAVVDHGSYAKAADALHKSQSSVTYAVQKLEQLLDVRAFSIEGRKSVLTPTGLLLYRRAHALLDEAAGVEKAARAISAGWEAEIGLAGEIIFPHRVLLECLNRFGIESPHTRIELIESVLAGTTEALLAGNVDLAISGQIPPGLVGDPLVPLQMIPVAHPDHPLHHLGRPPTARDLRIHRQLVVRESDTLRATKVTIDTAQRWTVTSMTTSQLAVTMGYGFGWFALENIRDELAEGKLKQLPLRDGRERIAQLYLVYADRENAGPGVLRLAAIIRETTAAACSRLPGGGSATKAPLTKPKQTGRAQKRKAL